ncbi:hypothetical protein L6258_02145 [Candidatus Parcubacteria bacterium]|nr:hypothetical protein [Candidatus Parcubacteria bacterium]
MAQTAKITEGSSHVELILPNGWTYQRDPSGNIWLKPPEGKLIFAFKLPFNPKQREFTIAAADFPITYSDGCGGEAKLRHGRPYPLPTGCRIAIRLDLKSGISIHLE